MHWYVIIIGFPAHTPRKGRSPTLPQNKPEFALFPYNLNELKVVGIDVRSRGTVQPRIFVEWGVMEEK